MEKALKALADPTRREILKALRAGDLAAGEIVSRFPLSGASISHHLGVLREAGLVKAERRGRRIIYSLESTVVQELVERLMDSFGVGGSR